VLPVLLALVLAVGAGCAAEGLKSGGGGLAQGDSAGLSAVVAQTRAQFPRLSAPDVPFTARAAPPGTREPPQLVLRGEGVGVQPGLQVGEQTRVQVALFLAKPGYDRGWVKLVFDGQGEQTWPILAYERWGRPDEAFEFAYALGAPEPPVPYLVVIGGRFAEGKTAYAGLEGTLVFPGPEAGLEGWRRAFKIDFGRRFPVRPAYQELVAEAEGLFRKLKRDVPTLASLAVRVEKSEGALEALRAGGGTQQGEVRAARIGQGEARLAELQARLAADAERVERELLRYFELRGLIAGAYATFTEGNPYLWALPATQQEFFAEWKTVESHHPIIDELTERVTGMLPDPGKLRAARAAAMEEVKRNDNWSRNPSRKGGNDKKPSG
jgi:hypothetical protein